MATDYLFVDNKNVVKAVLYTNTELSQEQFDALTGSLGTYVPRVHAGQEHIGTYKVVGEGIVPYSKILTKYQFNSLFTFEELVAITSASKSDLEIEVLQKKFEIADEINLNEDIVATGLALLVSKGILTQERADEIANS